MSNIIWIEVGQKFIIPSSLDLLHLYLISSVVFEQMQTISLTLIKKYIYYFQISKTDSNA